MPLPPAPATTDPDSTPATHRGRWVVVVLLASFCLIAWTSWKLARALGAFAWGFQPPAMAAAQHSTQDVIGDLGGMPVKISRFVAEDVEYEGDPGWSGPRKGPPPQRTYASRLMSFGFEVRYPDMAMLTTKELWADKRSYNIYNTPWVSVGVTTGPHYPGCGFMNRLDIPRERLRSENWWEDYLLSKGKVFGLEGYRLAKEPPPLIERSGVITRYGDTVYLHRDGGGSISTRIVCSDVPHLAALCTQTWDGFEQGAAAEIRAQYRRELLPHWRVIQTSVTRTILGFRAPLQSTGDETATSLFPSRGEKMQFQCPNVLTPPVHLIG